MKKQLQTLAGNRNRFNEKLKRKLENLPPTVRLNVILLALLLYGLITVAMLVATFRNSADAPEIRHIEPAPLIDVPVKHPQKESLLTEILKYNNH